MFLNTKEYSVSLELSYKLVKTSLKLFERWLIGLYNVLFTAAPPMALGLFDRPNKASTMLRFPELYKISQSKTDFNMTVFWSWMFNAFLHSILLYFTCAGSLSHG